MRLENRVALVPADVKRLTKAGVTVLVETTAGNAAGYDDKMYRDAGADIVQLGRLYDEAEIIVKVKQPLKNDFAFGLNEKHTLFSYLHYAGDPELQQQLTDNRITSYAFESLMDTNGNHILLEPMSKIAGKLSFNFALEVQTNWGKTLLNNMPGFGKSNVMILGLGNAGYEAAKMFSAVGCNVWGYDVNRAALDRAEKDLGISTFYSTYDNVCSMSRFADIIVGAALGDPRREAPIVLTKDMKQNLKKGAIVIDIAIDQGGCVEDIEKTCLDYKYDERDGVAYVAIPNMPGSVAKTSSAELSRAIVPYVEEMALVPLYTGTDFHGSLTTVKGAKHNRR